MIADQDRLSIITVVEQGLDKPSLQSKIERNTGQRPYDSVILQNDANTQIKDRIKRYLKEQDETDSYVDFVCVGNRGLNMGNAADGDNYLGSVANSMIAMRQLNVIFVP